MVFKYSENIANNPTNLLGPQCDNYISCLNDKFLFTLKERQLDKLTLYDSETDYLITIVIVDYMLEPTNGEYKTHVTNIKNESDYVHSYNLFLKIETYINQENISKNWICVGQIPKMQERGGFIRNKIRRVLLHQLIRSPGLYVDLNFAKDPNSFQSQTDWTKIEDPLRFRKSSARIIPQYGTWMKIEVDAGGLRHNLDNAIPFFLSKNSSKADLFSNDSNHLFYETQDRVTFTTESFMKTPLVLLLYALGENLSLSRIAGARNKFRNIEVWNNEIMDIKFELERNSQRRPCNRQDAFALLWRYLKPFKRRKVVRTTESVEELITESFYNLTNYNLGPTGEKQLCQQLGCYSQTTALSPFLTSERLCLIANHLITLRWDLSSNPEIGSLKYNQTNPESLNNRQMRAPGELLVTCIITELLNLERPDLQFGTKKFGDLTKLQNSKELPTYSQWEEVTQVDYNTLLKQQTLNQTIEEDFIEPEMQDNEVVINDNEIRLDLCSQLTASVNLKAIENFVFLFQEALEKSTRTFLNAIQISQLEDTLNPISDLTLKRRVSVLGPDGITRDQASITMRNIHPTTYGRLCPIETPEGQNAGLVRSLTMYSFIPGTGQIDVPFINFKAVQNNSFINYTNSFTDKALSFGLPDIMIAEKNLSVSSAVLTKQNLFFNKNPLSDCSFFGVTAIQLLSIGTTLTPFLEHNDATRVLMGSNMQRQSLPLINCERPIVGTGSEILIAVDSRYLKRSTTTGLVCGFNNQNIHILEDDYSTFLKNFYQAPKLFSFLNSCNLHKQQPKLFQLAPFSNYSKNIKKISLIGPKRSNKATISQHLLKTNIGDWINKGTVVASETGLENGQLALGVNLRVAYMPWDGFNFEDAIVFNQQTAFSGRLKTFHIKRFDVLITKKQQITANFNDVPGSFTSTHQHLDKDGFVIPGRCVRQGDALVGIVERNPSPNLWKVRLVKKLMKIDSDDLSANYELIEQSFVVPLGLSGRVITVQKRQCGDDIHVRIYLLIIRFLRVGDKLSGRHGNKGVISSLIPAYDMPYKPNGEQVDLILNPLGVPSRMNLGQIFECLLGLAGQQLQQRYKVIGFDEIFAFEASKKLCYTKLYEAKTLLNEPTLFNFSYPGKTWMFDGRNGSSFDQPVIFGISYILKLCHQVEEKLHGRATGQYSLITQQPVQGRARGGGQRIGEMEVWAFEGFGTSFMLQELLSIKSDEMDGRKEVAKALLSGDVIYTRDIQSYRKPQTLQTVAYEMKALCLDFRLLPT